MTMQEQSDPRATGTVALLDALGRLIRTARAAGHRHQAEYGLSGTPLGILKSLATGDARSGDLAVRLQIAPSVVSRALVPLEQAGLVERRPETADARAVLLGLTERGRERLAAARQDFVDRFAPLLEDWDTGDVATLAHLMDRLEHTLATQVEVRGAERNGPAAAALARAS